MKLDREKLRKDVGLKLDHEKMRNDLYGITNSQNKDSQDENQPKKTNSAFFDDYKSRKPEKDTSLHPALKKVDIKEEVESGVGKANDFTRNATSIDEVGNAYYGVTVDDFSSKAEKDQYLNNFSYHYYYNSQGKSYDTIVKERDDTVAKLKAEGKNELADAAARGYNNAFGTEYAYFYGEVHGGVNYPEEVEKAEKAVEEAQKKVEQCAQEQNLYPFEAHKNGKISLEQYYEGKKIIDDNRAKAEKELEAAQSALTEAQKLYRKYKNAELNLENQEKIAKYKSKSDFEKNSVYVEGKTPDKLKDFGTPDPSSTTGANSDIRNYYQDLTEQKFDEKTGLNKNHYTKAETQTILYLLNTQGYNAADEYIESIKKIVTGRKSNETYEKYKDDEVFGTLVNLAAGVEGTFTGIGRGISSIFNPQDYYFPTYLEGLAGNFIQNADSKAERYLYQGANAVGGMVVPMAFGVGGKVIGGTLGKALGFAGKGVFATQAYGGYYSDSINSGKSKGEAMGYATIMAGMEFATESLVGSIPGISSGSGASKLTKAISKTKYGGKVLGILDDTATKLFKNEKFRAGVSLAGRYVGEGLSEGVEEYLTEMADPVFRNLIFGEDNDFTLWSENQAESFIVGMIVGGVLNSPGTLYDASKITKGANAQIFNIKNSTKYTDAEKIQLISEIEIDSVIKGFATYSNNGLSFEEAKKQAKKDGLNFDEYSQFAKSAFDITSARNNSQVLREGFDGKLRSLIAEGKDTQQIAKAVISDAHTLKQAQSVMGQELSNDERSRSAIRSYVNALKNTKQGDGYSFESTVFDLLSKNEASEYVVNRILYDEQLLFQASHILNMPFDAQSENSRLKVSDYIKNLQNEFIAKEVNSKGDLSEEQKESLIKEKILGINETNRYYSYGALGTSFEKAKSAGLNVISEVDAHKAFIRGVNDAAKIQESRNSKTTVRSIDMTGEVSDANGENSAGISVERKLEKTSSIRLSKPLNEYSNDKQQALKEFIEYKNQEIEDAIIKIREGKADDLKNEYFVTELDEKTVKDISELLGYDISGFVCKVSKNTLQHIEKRHGVNGIKDHSMKNEKDIARMGYVVNNYDDIDFERKNGKIVLSDNYKDKNNVHSPTIQLKKKLNGTYFLGEVAPDSKKKTLWITTSFIQNNRSLTQESNAAEKSAPSSYVRNAPHDMASSNSIPKNKEVVKKKSVKKENARLVRDDNLKKVFISPLQIRELDALAKIIGRDILFTDKLSDGINAEIDINNGVMKISIKTTNGLEAAVIHETVHIIKEEDAETYNKLCNLVFDIMSDKKNKRNYKRFYDLMTKAYKDDIIDENGDIVDNWREIVDEEVVCELVSFVLKDEGILKSIDNTQRKPLEKLVDKMYELVQKIKGSIKPGTPVSERTKAVNALAKHTEEIANLFREGLSNIEKAQTSANAQAEVKKSRDIKKEPYDFTKSFYEQLIDFKNNKFPQNDHLVIGKTPKVLLDLGFNPLPLTIDQTHVGYALNKGKNEDHSVSIIEFATLEKELASPIAVIENAKHPGRALVLISMMINGKRTVCPIEIDGTSKYNNLRINSNLVISSFGDTKASEYLSDAIKREVNGEKSVYYIDKRKAPRLLKVGERQLLEDLTQSGGFVHSIREEGSKINYRIDNITESLQFKNWFGNWRKGTKNSSKVVDESGFPKIMYQVAEKSSAINDNVTTGKGLLCTSDLSEAQKYGKNIDEVYVNIRRPYILNEFSEEKGYKDSVAKALSDNVFEKGFDGIIVKDGNDIVLAIPKIINQIKSLDNRGTYDGSVANTKYSRSLDSLVITQEDEQFSESLRRTELDRWGKAYEKYNEEGISINEVIKKVKNLMNVQVSSGNDAGVKRPDVASQYKADVQAIKTKYNNDLPEIAHALGYLVDTRFGLEELVTKQSKAAGGVGIYESELRGVLDIHFGFGENDIREGIAEFVRLYLSDKDDARSFAPIFYDFFESKISQDKEFSDAFEESAKAISDYFHSTFGARARAGILTKEESEKLKKDSSFMKIFKQFKTTFRETYVDSFAGIHDVLKENGVLNLGDGEDPYILATASRFAPIGRAQSIIKDAFRDYEGNIIGESFTSILSVLGSKSSEKYKAFDEYLVMRHAPEWLEPRKTAVDGKTVQASKKIVFADKTLNNADFCRERARELEKKYPEFKDIAKKIYEYQDNIMKHYLVMSGAVSMEAYNRYKAMYPNYVPFNRYDDSKDPLMKRVKKQFVNLKSPIQTAVGGAEAIMSPLESIMLSTFDALDFAYKNRVMQNLTSIFCGKDAIPGVMERIYSDKELESLLRSEDANHKVILEPDFFSNSDLGEENAGFSPVVSKKNQVVYCWKNGKKVFYRIKDAQIYNSLASLTEVQIGNFYRVSNKILNFTKLGVTTYNILFVASNMARDFMTYRHNSGEIIFEQLYRYFGALWDMRWWKQSDEYKLYKAMGISGVSKYNTNVDNLREEIKKLELQNASLGKKIGAALSPQKAFGLLTLVEAYSKVNDVIEAMPRYAAFKKSLKKQGDMNKAAYDAADITTNFSRHGTLGRQMNATFMFYNAAVQGVSKLYRSYSEATPKQRVKKVAEKIWTGVLIAALQAFLMRDDEEAEEAYRNLSEFTKNNYDCYYIGNGKFAKFPKEREQAILRTATQRFIDAAFGDKVSLCDFGEYIVDMLSLPGIPSDLSSTSSVLHEVMTDTALGPFFDVAMNRDYKGDEIVPQSLSIGNEYEYEKYYDSTSKLAVSLAESLNKMNPDTDVSPLSIDHLINGYGGWYGKLAISLAPNGDVEEKGLWNTMLEKTGNPLEFFGFESRYVADSRYSTDLLDNMYERAQKADKALKQNKNGKNLLEAEKYIGFKSFMSGFSKATKTGSVEQRRSDRLLLQRTITGFEHENDEIDNWLISLYDKTGIEGIFSDSYPKGDFTVTNGKNKFEVTLDAMQYADFCNEINYVRNTVRKTVKGFGLTAAQSAFILQDLEDKIVKHVKEQFASKYGKLKDSKAKFNEKKAINIDKEIKEAKKEVLKMSEKAFEEEIERLIQMYAD